MGKNKGKKKKKSGLPLGRVDVNAKLPVRTGTFEDYYTIGPELGRGGMSVVYECVSNDAKERWAVKIVDKKNIDSLAVLEREINIMRVLAHPNILQLREVFKTADQIFIIMELITGGELFDQIVAYGAYNEHLASKIIQQVVSGVDYMHDHGVAHRDLKPENLLVGGDNDDELKIADFGLSKAFGGDFSSKLKTSCGTPDYVAPEVLMGQEYDNSVDLWSVGVITYILLCGFPPFYAERESELFDKILECRYDFPAPEWNKVSSEAKDFVKKLLVKDPRVRITAKQALEHPWLKNASLVDSKKEGKSLDSHSKIGDYSKKRKVRRGGGHK